MVVSSSFALDLANAYVCICSEKKLGISALDLAGLSPTESFMKEELKKISSMREKAFIADPYLPPPELNVNGPKLFPGSCQVLIQQIQDKVNNTLDDRDYNGLHGYIQLIDQAIEKKNFMESRILEKDWHDGGSCVGLSHAIVQSIASDCQGVLAVRREGCFHPFEHAAVLVYCEDGCVLIEPSLPACERFFTIRFNTPFQGKGFSIMASLQNGIPRLIIQGESRKGIPATRSEYWSNVINGDEIVLKKYLLHDGFIPITTYKKGQNKPYKVIKIFLDRSKVMFEDRSCSAKKMSAMDFQAIQTPDFFLKLEEFMEKDFKTPVDVLHAQILKIVSQKKLLDQVFSNIHRTSGHF